MNSTYLSNINFNFIGLLSYDSNIIRTYATVLNAQIPVSFYIIDDTNNILNYNESGSGKVITVPIGNYNGNQMVKLLNTGFTDNGSGIIASLNSNTGILSFLITNGLSYSFRSASTIKTILGFNSSITSTTLKTMPYQLNLL